MISPVTSVSGNFAVSPASSTASNSAGISAFDDLLALQAENLLLSIGATGTVNNTGLATSDLLDLSPAALSILNGIGSASTGITGNTTQLTPAQSQQAASIVAQFATAPFTQTTFNQIEAALTAAGINPQEVSIQQLLGGYSLAFTPGFAFNGQLFTDVLASDLSVT